VYFVLNVAVRNLGADMEIGSWLSTNALPVLVK